MNQRNAEALEWRINIIKYNQSHTFNFSNYSSLKGLAANRSCCLCLCAGCWWESAEFDKSWRPKEAEALQELQQLSVRYKVVTCCHDVAMVGWKSSFGNSCPALIIWFQLETDFNVKFAAPLLCGHHEMTGCFNYATTNSTCSRNFWNRCSCTRMCNVVWHVGEKGFGLTIRCFQTYELDENWCRPCQAGIMQELRFQPKAPETSEERAERLQKDLHNAHEKHRNAAFEMEHTLSIPENVSSTLAPFLGSDLIQQNHKIHLGITAIGFQLGFHMITRVHWSLKLAKSARLWRLWQDIENVQDRNRRLSLCLSAWNPLVQDWNLWLLS